MEDSRKEWRCWNPLRHMFWCCCYFGGWGCYCRGSGGDEPDQRKYKNKNKKNRNEDAESVVLQGSVVTGTLYGYKRGKVVSLCVQEDPRGPVLLLLELGVPTQMLVREMQSGLLRIALKCDNNTSSGSGGGGGNGDCNSDRPLLSEPTWHMYCNGRKVGFATRRHPGDGDRVVLQLMQSVTTGAGVIPLGDVDDDTSATKLAGGGGGGGGGGGEGEEQGLFYMRAAYERVSGSIDSESLHMINPDGAASHELSIFLLRSSSS